MLPETLQEIADWIKTEEVSVDDIIIHDNGVIGTSERNFYKSEEKQEWYRGENEWHYFDNATVLIRRSDVSSFEGRYSVPLEPIHNLHIWAD